MKRLQTIALVAATVLAGCTHNENIALLETQRLPLTGDKPVVLRAAHGGLVNLLDQRTDRLLYSGLVTVGDYVTLDPTAHTLRVRGVVAPTDLRPGDVVQITFQ